MFFSCESCLHYWQNSVLDSRKLTLLLLLLFHYAQLIPCSPIEIFRPKLDASFSTIHFEVPEENNNLRKHELCPEVPNTKLANYFFHLNTQQCYLRGTQGPCDENMIFESCPDDFHIGECHCQELNDRVQVFDGHTHQCFPVFSQGPCDENEWLIFDPVSNMYNCALNPCLENFQFETNETANQSENMIVFFNDRCVRLGHAVPECKENETIQFISGEIFPTCVESTAEAVDFATGALVPKKCRPGTSKSVNGKCIVNFFW